jgi:hypothetical protein
MKAVSIFTILCGAFTAQAQLLDRIAVSVDKQVITESALLLDRRVSAFLDGVAVDLTGTAKRKSAERLIDQMLILREAADSRIALPTKENATALLKQVKEQRGSEAAYQQALQEYGITESDLLEQLLSGLTAYTFSDLRFRPSVQISDEDISTFLEKMTDGTLTQAPRQDVEEILIRQRTEDALDDWLKMARAAAKIQFREGVFE